MWKNSWVCCASGVRKANLRNGLKFPIKKIRFGVSPSQWSPPGFFRFYLVGDLNPNLHLPQFRGRGSNPNSSRKHASTSWHSWNGCLSSSAMRRKNGDCEIQRLRSGYRGLGGTNTSLQELCRCFGKNSFFLRTCKRLRHHFVKAIQLHV